MRRSVRIARSAALSFVAVHMVVLPVSSAAQAQAAGTTPIDSEPPSISQGQALDASLLRPDLKDISFSARLSAQSEIVVPAQAQLERVEVGKSVETEQQEAAKQKAIAASKAQQARVAATKRKQAVARVLAAAPQAVTSSGSVQDMVHSSVAAAFGEAQWPAMATIIARESGFNPNSYNTSSGACGLFQALPCMKMGGMEVGNQISWGIGYIRNRYGSPSNAWNFWLAHGWY
ncbi:MAG: transglycosylase SLT domain-containing protein [bacterium]